VAQYRGPLWRNTRAASDRRACIEADGVVPEELALPLRVHDPVQHACPGPTPVVCDGLSGPNGIVLVDDEWIVLSRLRKIIEQTPDLIVVAACRCAEGGMLAVERYRPAVVILDVRMPDRDGVELIRDIIAVSGAKVIVFTAVLQEEGIVRVFRSGAEAIVFKDQPASTLVSCVRKVLGGESCILPHITTREGLMSETSGDVGALTPREREVVQCAAAGARNKEIAWQLGISEGTVKLHLFRAYRKLRVGNRVGLGLALRRASADTMFGITFVSLTFG
jgi:DNA-binding NarL/FixJ family response regulator